MKFDINLFKQIRESKDVAKMHESYMSDLDVKKKEENKEIKSGEKTTYVAKSGEAMDKVEESTPGSKDVKCPECGEIAWDVAKGSKLNKCWNCKTAFDSMEESKVNESPVITEPETKPETKPATKPRSPMAPQPGIQPKPKASVKNSDIELFKKVRENRK